MKLAEHFKSFLTDTVNLNRSRLELLEDSVETLKDVIRDSDWLPSRLTFAEQGSWAHGTIIKPVEGKAFDADLVIIVDPVDGWNAQEYLSTLRKIFASHKTYEDKVRRFSHCVTIEYAGERKVDLAPCVRNRTGLSGHEVCNYNNNTFERSEPEAFTDWLRDRNSWTGGNGLKKVTRLLKHLRDIKGNFSCPSILFTTLLGMQINCADSLMTELFADIPTALKTIVGRLDNWLQARPTKPLVANPVLATESFSDLLDEDQYDNFRDKINLYRIWIDEAFDEPDRDESIGKWRRVFGDDFASGVVLDKTASVMEGARLLALARGASNLVLDVRDDLVGLIRRFGPSILPSGFDKRSYKRQPTWRKSPHGGYKVKASGSLYTAREGTKIADIASGQGPLAKGQWLRFAVMEAGGTSFGTDKYRVHWRITNTGREAENAGSLRGGFEEADDGTARWEHLQYRGVHMAEAFIVRRKDKMLVGHSDPFYVVID